jgi:hypothetical protein
MPTLLSEQEAKLSAQEEKQEELREADDLLNLVY